MKAYPGSLAAPVVNRLKGVRAELSHEIIGEQVKVALYLCVCVRRSVRGEEGRESVSTHAETRGCARAPPPLYVSSVLLLCRMYESR